MNTSAAEPLVSESLKPVTKWAAVAGRWKTTKSIAKYEAPDAASGQLRAGLLLAGPRMQDGSIATVIKRNAESESDSAAGIFVGYQSLHAPYLTMQIGGFDNAFAIAEYRPDVGFIRLTGAGSIANLESGQAIHLKVQVLGQTIRMSVDDVDVLSYVMPRPIEGSGYGLYAWGDSSIEFSHTEALAIPPKVFVIMPFAEPFDSLYRDVIKVVTAAEGFEVVRVDEVTGPGMILDDIQQQIEQSHAVVAEISTHNPNVFYELGYAHALRKPAILLVRRTEGDKMPFDIRGYRAIFYDDSIGGKNVVERNLKQHLQAILRERVRPN